MGTNIVIGFCGLVFGAICLAVGYGLGKKAKIKAQVEALIGLAKDKVKDEVSKL